MKVSVLGLGIIGSAWAQNLIADKMDVRCWNRTPKEFQGFTPDIREAVRGAEFVIVVVSDPAAVQSVIDAIHPELGEGMTVIQSSTISAEWSRKFGEQVQSTGALFLEAPFTGSKPAAEHRKTVFYVGGEHSVVQHSRPLLDRLSNAILHIGALGSASSLKLAMNLNIAGIAQALCESLSLARSEGIPDDVYFDALRLNASRSGISDLKEPKLKSGDFTAQFSVKHMAKDLRLARETAHSNALPIPVAEKVLEQYSRAVEIGLADDDFIGLIRLLRNE